MTSQTESKAPLAGTSASSELPAKMRRAIIRAWGDSKAVQVEEAPLPVPKKGDVLIKVEAASINPVDKVFGSGNYSMVLSLPLMPGFDVAGTVVGGGSANTLKVGTKVWAMTHFKRLGTFAEYVAVPANLVAPVPENLTWAEAASLPLVGETTVQGFRHGKFKRGQTALILGGTGGTGIFAIQWAKHLGAKRVIATCSGGNEDLCKSLGADETIDYKTTKYWEVKSLHGAVDMIYDCVGGLVEWENSHKVLKPSTGNFITIVGDGSGFHISIGFLVKTGLSWINRGFWGAVGKGPNYNQMTTAPTNKDLHLIGEAVKKGEMKAVLDSWVTLDKIQDAYARMATGRAKGKIVIVMTKEAAEQQTKRDAEVKEQREAEAKKRAEQKEKEKKDKEAGIVTENKSAESKDTPVKDKDVESKSGNSSNEPQDNASPRPSILPESAVAPAGLVFLNESSPAWVPDSQAPACQVCKGEFTVVRRKHHCRLCGHVICNDCSNSETIPKVRICQTCAKDKVKN